ncbi:hypothetical protein R5R35_003058 [Gryllus longicercus]|uniref:Uncharacterized protein n=1 Tax=Gryllus longicercus TaxID=2509291 RepID=A0AAN9VNC3_9ORTH
MASTGGSQLNEPPCMLNTVFEVLLPLEPKISGNHSFDCNRIGNENTLTSMMLGKAQFNFCKNCGGLEDYCKCAGSGDFEKAVTYKESIKSKLGQKISDNVATKDVVSDREYELSSQDENLEQKNSSKQEERYFTPSSSVESNHIQDLDTKQNNKMPTFVEDLHKTDIEVDSRIDETFEEKSDNETMHVPNTESSIEIENFTENENTEGIVGSELVSKIEEVSWADEQKSEINTSTRVPSEDGDNLGNDGLQVFEQMDLDDIHLEISPKLDLPLLEELKEADKKSKRTAHLINQIKESIKKFQSKENLTEEDTLVIKIKQVELAKKLAEFEEITRRVQNLVGLAELNNIEHSVTVSKIDDQTEISKSISLTESMSTDLPTAEENEEKSKDVSPEPSEAEHNFVSEDRNEDSAKVEEMEIIHTKNSFSPLISEDKISFLGKDNEVTNFLMMDKIIPKVIVCGSQDSMPRVIVCEKPNTQPASSTSYIQSPIYPEFVPPFPFKEAPLFDKKTEVPEMMISLSGRLSESYILQEKLATENAVLEDGRYFLQEELLKRDNIVDALQKKVGCLQSEMRIIAKENIALQEKLEEFNNMDCGCNKKTKATGRPMPPCCPPYPNNNLERQLNMIEGEVRNMQTELQQVQKERQQLEQQRKQLKPGGGQKPKLPCIPQTCTCGPNAGRGENAEQSLRELREQYARLEDDFKNKVAEVSSLRHELEKCRCKCQAAEEAQEAAEAECRCYQTQLKSAEQEAKKMLSAKEQMMEQDQQLCVCKQRFREAQDELEELRALIQDQTTQLEDYRNKYLQAQQQVEEQRRQIDVMEMENSRISDQVNLEIQRVKAQFQEKLQELTPLPDILKATQLKLQECQQARILAEHNVEELSAELQAQKDQLDTLKREMDDNITSRAALGNDVLEKLKELEAKCNDLRDENSRLRSELIRLDEIAAQAQRRLEEKSHDAAQLAAQLDTVREESARQVARTKDRAETMRRSLQCQISEMERQLAQSRATARSAQKDRDEIRQRMQCQINNLNESFEQAQMRIRSLQSHVNFLKSSYSNIFEPNTNTAIECACPNYAQEFNY